MKNDAHFWDELAIQSYKYLLKTNPDHPLIHHNLGLAYQRMSQDDLAIRHFKKAVKNSATPEDAYYHLTTLLMKTNRTKKAQSYMEHYKEVVEKNPKKQRKKSSDFTTQIFNHMNDSKKTTNEDTMN